MYEHDIEIKFMKNILYTYKSNLYRHIFVRVQVRIAKIKTKVATKNSSEYERLTVIKKITRVMETY